MASRCREVAKISMSGEILATYRSVTEAAEAEYVTRKTMNDWLKGRVKSPYIAKDYRYKYLEEVI